jgi:hypothetical protein
VTLTFTVPIGYRRRVARNGRLYWVSDLRGYVAMTYQGRFTKRAKEYHSWAGKVRWEALKADFLRFPLPEAGRRVRVETECRLPAKCGRVPEAGNVQKGVVDALYYAKWLPLAAKLRDEGRNPGSHLDTWVDDVALPHRRDCAFSDARVVVSLKVEEGKG